MNEQLVLDMAKPFVKDGRLTYEQYMICFRGESNIKSWRFSSAMI